MDIPLVDIPQEELLVVLVPMANYIVIYILKAIGVVLDGEGWMKVNGALGVGLGLGIAGITEGEPLPRVIIGALAGAISALGSITIHHGGSTVRAVRAKLRAEAAVAEDAALVPTQDPVDAEDPSP